MFVDNRAVKEFGDERKTDKFAIASTMFDVNFEGTCFSLIESQVLSSCEGVIRSSFVLAF